MPQPDSADFFRQPLAEMIDLCNSLAVLAPHFASQAREGRAVAQKDLFVRPACAGGGVHR